MKIIEINIQEPYYSSVLNGKKKIEGRLNKGKFLEAEIGDTLKINNQVNFKLINKREYSSFKDMISMEGVENVIPDKKTIEEAVNVYYKFYSKADERKYGVIALEIKELKD